MAEKKEKKTKLTWEQLQSSLKKEKKYGISSSKTDWEVIPTGSLLLDKATGIGGFPRGGIVEMYAEFSAGKTFIAQKVCANAIAMGLKAAYIDAEHSVDPDWAAFNGLDIEDEDVVTFAQPDSLEDSCNLVKSLVDSGMYAVIVMDSLSSMCPQAELEGAIGDMTVGLKARRLNQFWRMISGPLKKTNTLLVTTGQLRDTIGGNSFGDTSTTDYGNGLKFAAWMRIRYYKGTEKDAAGNPIANNTTARFDKNKCSITGKKAKFQIVYGQGIDNYKELFDIAKEYKVITTSGSWCKFGEESIGQGYNGFKAALLEEPALLTNVLETLNEKLESATKAEAMEKNKKEYSILKIKENEGVLSLCATKSEESELPELQDENMVSESE